METEQEIIDRREREGQSHQAYIDSTDEEKLRLLSNEWESQPIGSSTRTFYEGRMLEITIGMDNHPEWFQHGCMCDECCSID